MNYRLCLTNVSSNRLPLAPPANYTPAGEVVSVVNLRSEVDLWPCHHSDGSTATLVDFHAAK